MKKCNLHLRFLFSIFTSQVSYTIQKFRLQFKSYVYNSETAITINVLLSLFFNGGGLNAHWLEWQDVTSSLCTKTKEHFKDASAATGLQWETIKHLRRYIILFTLFEHEEKLDLCFYKLMAMKIYSTIFLVCLVVFWAWLGKCPCHVSL